MLSSKLGGNNLFPAHAGVILRIPKEIEEDLTFPRTRGGDPGVAAGGLLLLSFSPHMRG